jgi:hypothetical protein
MIIKPQCEAHKGGLYLEETFQSLKNTVRSMTSIQIRETTLLTTRSYFGFLLKYLYNTKDFELILKCPDITVMALIWMAKVKAASLESVTKNYRPDHC